MGILVIGNNICADSKKISSDHFMEPKGLGYFANNLPEDSLFMEEGDFVGHP